MRSYVGAKIHDITVTDKSIRYFGSVSICQKLMAEAGIEPYEQVHVVNLDNGNRWVTYALPSKTPGAFTLNGGGARLGEIGDRCVILTYRMAAEFPGAKAVFCDPANKMIKTLPYGAAE
jgi:aspartate 1-decarboxylase